MVVKVKLSRSLKKRVVVNTTTPIGFFWAIIHWVMISDSPPWLCPSLLGLVAGVVHLHQCERERRVTGRADFRSAGTGGLVGTRETCLHCTARMATDPEIAGV